MRSTSLACLAAILCLPAGNPAAWAQTLPIDLILPPRQATPSVSAASAAQGFNLSEASPPTAAFGLPESAVSSDPQPQPENAAEAGTEAERQTEAVPVLTARAPLPPPRPALAEAPLPLAPQPAAASAAEPAAQEEFLPNNVIVERANAYFMNIATLVADFTQVGGNGERMQGTLFLQRPGKVRFEYDPPATLEVVADGRSVAVRDKKLATQDLYSISQTPLKFLLREQVDLGRDIPITGITRDDDSVRINLEDRSMLAGTSRITLYFDPQVKNLTQWRIVDAQGFRTVVVLDNVERGHRLDQALFRINYETLVGSNK